MTMDVSSDTGTGARTESEPGSGAEVGAEADRGARYAPRTTIPADSRSMSGA